MKRILIIVWASVLLSSCAVVALRKDIAETKAICESAVSPELREKLSGKIALVDVNEITGAMLSNPNKPTPDEAAAITALDQSTATCRTRTLALAQKLAPATLPAYQEQYYKNEIIIGKLAAGQLSYGDANRQQYEVFLDAQKQYTILHQQEVAQAQADNERAQQDLANAAAYFGQMAKPWSPFAPANAPTTTNCYRNGYYTTCTTN